MVEKQEQKQEQKINFAAIEKKWQDRWEKEKCFAASEKSKNPKYYVLEMFPYPSASGLHMGHALNYTIGDIFSRYKRMNGFNVLYPMGFDALGLPAENAAIKEKAHPRPFTEKAIANYIRQMKQLGLSYDWGRTVKTCDSEYYRWNQYFFLKFLEKGLVYRKKAAVNWCPKCQTVLANEQVHSGKCWRHEDTDVEIKQLEQWFIKTTDYADELLEKAKTLDWPDRIKLMQDNWIGKSYGSEIEFEIENRNISNCILVHGSPSRNEKSLDVKTRTYDKHWMPWLKNELGKKGISAEIPSMPTPWEPKYNEWKKEFEKLSINENSVLIGHSSGGGFLVRWLGETKKKIKKLILVAPAIIHSGEWKPLENLLKFDIDSSITNNVGEIKIFVSKDDSQGIIKAVEIFSERLGVSPTQFEGHGHFTQGDMKTEEFPELLSEIIFQKWPIFTTRPDTIFGVTFMVVSAQHPKLMELVTPGQKKAVEAFLKKLKSVSEKELDEMEKEGVFTGSYAINPANNVKVPVYAGNFVVADYGSGMVMAVPSHDQRDFEFAKKYKIEIREVIAPIFRTEKGPDAVRSDKKIVERDSVFGIVKHWKEDKYFCLDWKNFGWKSFVIGGIDKGETSEQSVIREVKEETGYQDIKSVKPVGIETHAMFFARHKDENRHGKFKTFLIELKSDKYSKPAEEHTKNHTGQWVDKKDVANYLNLENNKFLWDEYLNGGRAYTGTGILVNSGKFNGLDSEKAKEEIIKELEKKNLGKKTVNYKLRDWLVSRQRYWGTPIPVVYCDKCGIVAVPEKDLPVILPENVKFGEGNPLATNSEFVNVKCPKCKGKGRRETDTMDTFFDSSWYYLRYCDSKNSKKPFDSKKIEYWMPVDQYIGGAEHACMHLIYARFFTKALRDLGFLKFDEPFLKLFNQGMLHGEDGEKMSKSKGNVILPETVSNKYGIDTARIFLISQASPEKDTQWDEKGIEGSLRLINRIYEYFSNFKQGKSSPRIESKINKSIKEIGADIGAFKFNLAVIKIRQLFEVIEKESISRKDAESFLKMLSVLAPHISEEVWEKLGNKSFISLEKWPSCDESKIDEKLEEQERQADKTIQDINNILRIVKEKQGKDATKVYLYVLPKELEIFDAEELSKKVGKQVKVFAVNDKAKHDPEGKASKAKPGKPGIYIE